MIRYNSADHKLFRWDRIMAVSAPNVGYEQKEAKYEARRAKGDLI